MTDRGKAHTRWGGLKAHIVILMGLWTILVGAVYIAGGPQGTGVYMCP